MNSEAFQRALEFMLSWEGGYSNHPDDPGGETYRGVTRKNHPTWLGWLVIDEKPRRQGQIIMDQRLEYDVAEFYFDEYWRGAKCDVIEQIAPSLAISVFDAAVNHGPSRAIMMLQQLIGTPDDGKFGPQSQLKLISYMDRTVAVDHTTKRRAFYQMIVANNPSQRVFRQGWANRVDALVKLVKGR